MQISDLMNSYQNMLAAGGGKVPEGTQGVEQLVSTLAKLQVGQIFEGTVNSVKGSQVILGLSSGQNITARLDKGVSVEQGESVFFQVKKNDGKMISIHPVSIGGESGNPALENALRAAQIPQTESTIRMVDEMMKNQMPIDTKSLTDMARLVAMHPEADVQDIVTLKQSDLPVTDEMLTQLSNYKAGEGALMTGLSDLSGAIESAFAMEETDPAVAGEFLREVSDVIYPGEKAEPQQVQVQTLQQEALQLSEDGLATGQLSEENITPDGRNIRGEGMPGADILISSEQPQEEKLARYEYPVGSAGRAFSEETFSSISQTLKEDPEFGSKYPDLFDKHGNLKKDATVKDILLAVTEHASSNPEKLKKLSASGTLKELLSAAFTEKYSLEPREIREKGKIDDMYQKMQQDMQRLSQSAKEIMPNSMPLAQAAMDVKENIDFINQVNQMYSYIQIPIKLSGQDATGELYVYNNKKRKKEDSDEVTAFLHFDLEHLGSTDISVRMKGKNVDTQFYMADDRSYELVANNIHILEAKLEELGYNCKIGVESGGKPVNFVEDFIKRDAPTAKSSSLLRYSFDVRA